MLSKLKSEKKHRSHLLMIGLLAVALCVGVELCIMREDINQKRVELEKINQDLNDINVQNEQLRHYSSNENRMEYIEQIARDQLDYSHSDETVYYFVPK